MTNIPEKADLRATSRYTHRNNALRTNAPVTTVATRDTWQLGPKPRRDCGLWAALQEAFRGDRVIDATSGVPVDIVQCKADMKEAIRGHRDDWLDLAGSVNRLTGYRTASQCGQSRDAIESALQDALLHLPMLEQYLQGAAPIVKNQVNDASSWRLIATCLSWVFGDIGTAEQRHRARQTILVHTHPDKTPFLDYLRKDHGDSSAGNPASDLDLLWNFSMHASEALKSPMFRLGLVDFKYGAPAPAVAL